MCVTSFHHLQQLGVGKGILAPDDGHGLGASMSVTFTSRGSHPAGSSKDWQLVSVTVLIHLFHTYMHLTGGKP